MKDIDKLRQENPFIYKITQEKQTERAFTGEYLAEKRAGIYHCYICNNVLFDAATKYDSGSGWPSFWQVAGDGSVGEHIDMSHGMERVEIVCQKCHAHLGHVFPDGPKETTGQRYCVNSAALSFVPSED